MAVKTVIQVNTNRLIGTPIAAQGVVPVTVAHILNGKQARISGLSLYAAAASIIGLVALLKDSAWEAGQVTAAGVYTVDTTDAQDIDTNDFVMEVNSTNDGFLIGADVKFNVVDVDVTTAGVGSTGHIAEYWNGAAWVEIPSRIIFDADAAVWATTAERLLVFATPVDWVKGGSGTGVNQNRYNIRVRSDAGTVSTSALARRIYVGQLLYANPVAQTNTAHPANPFSEIVLNDIAYLSSLATLFGTTNAGHSLNLVLKEGLV